ncbi:MAG: aminoacyl-tRNA hydrolase [Endomicrobiales bacterium]|nr:aminoacyl-tRNA hydrolase [Endomicrobiales bacterium]
MANIKLIVGLGNPGEEYKKTRHNLGFRVVDEFAEKQDGKWRNWERLAKTSTIDLIEPGYKLTLAKPQKYMNNSGLAVRKLIDYFNISPQELLVVVDDFSLVFGKIRLRSAGSSGGHNGLTSIIEHINTSDFPRLRLGIGPVPSDINHSDYVLSNFTSTEESDIGRIIEEAVKVVETILTEGMEKAASKINTPIKQEDSLK